MVRGRLTVLATLVALLAPWVAPCMTTAPAGHAQMACCKTALAGVPAARPCCAPADSTPLAPPEASARLAPAPAIAVAAVGLAPAFTGRLHAAALFFSPPRRHLPSTILLI